MHIAGLILGIIACSGIIPGLNLFTVYFALPAGIVGIILSIIARKKLLAASKPAGAATAGLVLSIIGTALALVGVICVLVCVGAAAAAAGAATDAFSGFNF